MTEIVRICLVGGIVGWPFPIAWSSRPFSGMKVFASVDPEGRQGLFLAAEGLRLCEIAFKSLPMKGGHRVEG
jgi:hypothetical protein